MNTKKVFFGLLAFSFLAMATVASTSVDVEENQKTNIDREKIVKL